MRPKRTEKKKVIVIGAGLAGLSAAYELSQNPEIELHILEERSKVGGRVCSQKIKGQAVDFGGFIIYAWYTQFHELIEKLHCKSQLKKIPLAGLYYDIEGDGVLQNDAALKLPLNEILSFFLKTFPDLLMESDPSLPHLHRFEDLSIEAYLKKLGLKEKEDFYIKMFDTIAQGYCYGSAKEYKMAFTAATIHQNVLHGDIQRASYFPNGTQVFTEKMVKAIQANSGIFHLNTIMKKVSKNKITTNKGDFSADAIVFAQTPTEVEYTHFLTATVEFEKTIVVENDKNWGACFYHNDSKNKATILSAIHLKQLYSKKLDRCINVNIKISKPSPKSEAKLFQEIRSQLEQRFPGNKPLRILKMVEWEKTMPIAKEKFVEKQIENQGKDGHFFAGDFLGCPSMETALMSGKRAAEALTTWIKSMPPA